MSERKEAGPAGARPRTRRVISLRWIVAGAGLVLTVAIVLAMGGVAEREQRRALTREMESRLVLSARNLAMTSSRALLSDFPELTLTPILAEMREGQPEQVFAVVTDGSSVIRGHADARLLGTPFALPSDVHPQPTAAPLRPDERFLADPEVFVAAAPVLHPAGHTIGTAYVAFRRDYVDNVIAGARRAQMIVVLGALLLGTLVVPLVMTRLLRPLGVLRTGLERIGRGDLDTPIRLNDRTELGLLAETVNDMAGSLKRAERERIERERLAREVELAREIQSSLLPAAGLSAGRFRVEGSHRAAAEVGGDFYDVGELPDGRIALAVADVAGKGLGGCLVTFMLAGLLRAFRAEETSPKRLLVRLDETLRGSLRPGTFITMFYGILDPADGTLVFASAGHSPLLVRRAGGAAEWIRTKGIPIGAVRSNVLARTLTEERVSLAPGDVAVQFTDGVNEAFDPTGEHQFGFEGLEASVQRAAGAAPERLLARIRGDIDAWCQGSPAGDDETLLVVAAAPSTVGATRAPQRPGDPVTILAEARKRGTPIRLPASLDALEAIQGWLAECRGIDALDARSRKLVETALYEVGANIAEHGYGEDPRRSFELIWMPVEPSAGAAGHFVLVDDGVPFQPPATSVDFSDPAVRRRGRGLGLEIIRSAMQHVSYHPGTPAGNVTILAFDPSKLQMVEVVSHG